MKILGISAFYHDSAVAIIDNENILAAAQEERFSRKKHDAKFPVHAIKYCLAEAKLNVSDLEYIGFYDKPFLKFERLLETYLAEAPRGFISFAMAIPVWLKEKLFLKDTIVKELVKIEAELNKSFNQDDKAQLKAFKEQIEKKLLFAEHHESHAASAFYPSPYEDAAVLTMDGVGEWVTTSIAHGNGNELKFLKEIHFPHSLGLLYSAITYYCGFKVNSGEYKLMGLAPYGVPQYVDLIKDNLIDIKEDGSFKLDMSYFNYTVGLTMTNKKLSNLFGQPVRSAESELTQFHMDVAASIQVVTEEIMLKLAKTAKELTGSKNLCLAGGVALNCVGNGKLLEAKIFDNIFIQPASGDAGGALGAAQAIYYKHCKQPRVAYKSGKDNMKGSYLGKSYSNDEVKAYLDSVGAKYEFLSDEQLADRISSDVAGEKVLGWHQGRMEFGPRALGARSIIGDARSPKMQSIMNLKIKYRESFRPFAPIVLREDLTKYFEIADVDSPYMLMVAPVKQSLRKEMTDEQNKLFGIEKLNIERSSIPAVTHVDYSARLQTVHADTNPKLYNLLTKFKEKTDSSVLINTSFNVRGEPIVCTPEDSYKCFMRTGMDVLVIENFVMYKAAQPEFKDDESWKNEYELD